MSVSTFGTTCAVCQFKGQDALSPAIKHAVFDVEPVAFTLTDPDFYDLPLQRPASSPWRYIDYGVHVTPPHDWERNQFGVWQHLSPKSCNLPPQGWKIHVAPLVAEGLDTLDAVSQYCFGQGLAFKFLRNSVLHTLTNTKHADRSASGKFITIYPPDDDTCVEVLDQLATLLSGHAGPYVLSDLRWRDSPVFVRYGAFRAKLVATDDQRLSPAIESNGHLIPDRRDLFTLPSGIGIPKEILRQHEHLLKVSYSKFEYEQFVPLKFSNSGGVYRAVRKSDGATVVLKEARPFAGLDAWGEDAVQRLRHEAEALRALRAVPEVPKLYRCFRAWEHDFLELEYIEGMRLSQWRGVRFPYVRANPNAADPDAYVKDVLKIVAEVSTALDQMTEIGWVFGDLHTQNVLVGADDHVKFVDFEVAQELSDLRPARLQAPAFRQTDKGLVDAQHEHLNNLLLSMFVPAAEMSPLSDRERQLWIAWVHDHFPVPPGLLEGQAERPGRSRLPEFEQELNAAQLCRSLELSATPLRTDRLFPGDPQQFSLPPASFAYGAAGVLWALAQAGHAPMAGFLPWLASAVVRDNQERLGLYDGLAGALYVLRQLGDQHADDALDSLLNSAQRWTHLGASMFSGVAGISGVLSAEYKRNPADEISSALHQCTELLSDAIHRWSSVDHARQPRGLMFGAAGVAASLCWIADALPGGNELDLCAEAMTYEIARLETMGDGSRQTIVRGKVWPYLAEGTAGVALALREVQHRGVFEDVDVRPLLTACQVESVVEPQLFEGRAGLMGVLAMFGTREVEVSLKLHKSLLPIQMRTFAGGVGFPGNGLARMSMDFATGTAGILAAMTVIDDPSSCLLPLFAPPLAEPGAVYGR